MPPTKLRETEILLAPYVHAKDDACAHSVGNLQGRWRTSSYDGHLRVYGTRSFVITAALHEILGWAQCYPICQGFPYAALTFGHGRHACKRGLYRVLRISVQIPFTASVAATIGIISLSHSRLARMRELMYFDC